MIQNEKFLETTRLKHLMFTCFFCSRTQLPQTTWLKAVSSVSVWPKFNDEKDHLADVIFSFGSGNDDKI
jgi:hypothetical protein